MTTSCSSYSDNSIPHPPPILPFDDFLELKLFEHLQYLKSVFTKLPKLPPSPPRELSIDTSGMNFDTLMLVTGKVMQSLSKLLKNLQGIEKGLPPTLKNDLEKIVNEILEEMAEIEAKVSKTPTKNAAQLSQSKTTQMEKLRISQNKHELDLHATSMHHTPRRA